MLNLTNLLKRNSRYIIFSNISKLSPYRQGTLHFRFRKCYYNSSQSNVFKIILTQHWECNCQKSCSELQNSNHGLYIHRYFCLFREKWSHRFQLLNSAKSYVKLISCKASVYLLSNLAFWLIIFSFCNRRQNIVLIKMSIYFRCWRYLSSAPTFFTFTLI